MNKRLTSNIQILIGASLFGIIPVILKYSENTNTIQIIFFRALFGMISIFIIGYLTGNKIKKIKFYNFKFVLWSFILLLAIVSYFFSLKYIDIASSVLLLNLNSTFIIILSFFWLKEKISFNTILSLLFSLTGAILIISPSNFNFQGNSIGYLFALSAAFWTGLNFVYPKKYLIKYDAYTLTFYQNFLQLPFLLPFLFNSKLEVSLKNIIIYLILGFFSTALAFLLIYMGSKNTKTQYIGILQTSESILPIILGIILFHEKPTIIVLVGGFMLIIGYFLILYKNKTKFNPLNDK